MSQEKYSSNETEALADNCRKGSAESAGLKTYDENAVQNDVESRCDSDKYEGVSGVPHAPENAAYGVIAIDEHKAQNARETVIFCLLPGFRVLLPSAFHCVIFTRFLPLFHSLFNSCDVLQSLLLCLVQPERQHDVRYDAGGEETFLSEFPDSHDNLLKRHALVKHGFHKSLFTHQSGQLLFCQDKFHYFTVSMSSFMYLLRSPMRRSRAPRSSSRRCMAASPPF